MAIRIVKKAEPIFSAPEKGKSGLVAVSRCGNVETRYYRDPQSDGPLRVVKVLIEETTNKIED